MNRSLGIKNIAEQIGGIKALYPHFKIYGTGRTTHLKIIGELQPTPRSCRYQFVLKYQMGKAPNISIASPNLIKNGKGENIPHLYSDGSLCLYHPLQKEFQFSNLIANTIIPWISLWLYYYETWHITGDWLGGGKHPSKHKT